MADGNALSALYPQPVQPQQQPNALLSDPAKAVGLMDAVTRLRLLNEQAPALAQQPQAALTGQNISNMTAQQAQDEQGTQIAAHYFGTLPDNATPDDVYRMKMAIRATHPNIPAQTINTTADTLLQAPAGMKSGLATLRTIGISPEAMVSRVTGPPGPQGQPTTIPTTTAVRVPGAMATGLPPGVGGALEESQKSLVEDQKTSARTLGNLRNLDIALPAIEKLNSPNFGPGSSGWSQFKGGLITAGIIDPKTSDVTVRQEVGKYLLKYATLAQNSGRSDQALGGAVRSNPNLDLTQPANLGLIKNQIGLDKMDAALPSIFKAEHPGEDERALYNEYKSDYYNRFDRRVFSYDKLTPDERREVVQSLGAKNSPAYKKFAQTYQLAKKAGVIVPDKQ